MKVFHKISTAAFWVWALLPLAGGCHGWEAFYQRPTIAPLGAQSDAIWQRQEMNAEASDFVIYQHEFESGNSRFNMGGEDHVRSIAARLHTGADFPVIVERSMMSEKENSEFKYPVHPNPELDMQRRELVVRSLAAMGVGDAEQRVLVASPLTPGFKATEAARAYYQGLNQNGTFGSGFGGFGGAWFGGSSGGLR